MKHSSIDSLIKMANQIAANFPSGADDKASDIARHIRRFWTPAMIAHLGEHEAAGGEGMSPLARAAVRLLLAPIAEEKV